MFDFFSKWPETDTIPRTGSVAHAITLYPMHPLYVHFIHVNIPAQVLIKFCKMCVVDTFLYLINLVYIT